MATDYHALIARLEEPTRHPVAEFSGSAEVETSLLREAAAALRELTQWRSMDDAPKNARILLLLPDGNEVFGKWNDDRYANRARPYWSNDMERIMGVTWCRANQPTGWLPLHAKSEA